MTEGVNGFSPIESFSTEKDEGIDLANFSKEDEIQKFADFHPVGWSIALRLYVKPQKVGSIFMTSNAHNEQQYQSCVGLVVRKSKDAYNDSRYARTGNWCEIGDWMVFPRHSGTMIHHKGLPVFIINEDAVLTRVDDPSTITR